MQTEVLHFVGCKYYAVVLAVEALIIEIN